MSTQEALYEELATLCRRLRLKYVREELREVVLPARQNDDGVDTVHDDLP